MNHPRVLEPDERRVQPAVGPDWCGLPRRRYTGRRRRWQLPADGERRAVRGGAVGRGEADEVAERAGWQGAGRRGDRGDAEAGVEPAVRGGQREVGPGGGGDRAERRQGGHVPLGADVEREPEPTGSRVVAEDAGRVGEVRHPARHDRVKRDRLPRRAAERRGATAIGVRGKGRGPGRAARPVVGQPPGDPAVALRGAGERGPFPVAVRLGGEDRRGVEQGFQNVGIASVPSREVAGGGRVRGGERGEVGAGEVEIELENLGQNDPGADGGGVALRLGVRRLRGRVRCREQAPPRQFGRAKLAALEGEFAEQHQRLLGRSADEVAGHDFAERARIAGGFPRFEQQPGRFVDAIAVAAEDWGREPDQNGLCHPPGRQEPRLPRRHEIIAGFIEEPLQVVGRLRRLPAVQLPLRLRQPLERLLRLPAQHCSPALVLCPAAQGDGDQEGGNSDGAEPVHGVIVPVRKPWDDRPRALPVHGNAMSVSVNDTGNSTSGAGVS